MWDKKRGFIYGAEIIPLVIALAVSVVIVLSVALPVMNQSYWTNDSTNITTRYSGTTSMIVGTLLPLTAVLAIVFIAATVIGLTGRRD